MKNKEEIYKKKADRRYARVNKIIASKTGDDLVKANKKYGYNYESAISAGLSPDETGHWPSRNPDTGEILKGKKHPTFFMTRKGERSVGYKIKKVGGKLYSQPKKRGQ